MKKKTVEQYKKLVELYMFGHVAKIKDGLLYLRRPNKKDANKILER